MALVVQKYGGSSVADADGVKRVAQRIVAKKKAGNDVVVVVSAMGDTTDDLIDMAKQVSPLYSYFNHWGNHAGAALPALHAHVANARLDVAPETAATA